MEEPPIIKPPLRTPPKSPLKGCTLLFFAVFGGMVLFAYFFLPHPPKESQLLRNFYRNRAAFEQLRAMLEADTQLRRVADDWENSLNGSSGDRWSQYRTLLKQVGAKVAYRSKGEHPDIGVLVWGWGWGSHTRHIEVCWMPEAPTNLVTSIDGYTGPPPYGNRQGVCRHLEGNWYFWTDMRKFQRQTAPNHLDEKP